MTDPGPRAGLFRQLAATLKPWRNVLALVAALVLLAAADLVPPLLVRRIIDHHLITGRTEGLLALALLYFGAIAGVQVATFGYSYLVSAVAQGVLHNLRVRLFSHLQHLPVSYFDARPRGISSAVVPRTWTRWILSFPPASSPWWLISSGCWRSPAPWWC